MRLGSAYITLLSGVLCSVLAARPARADELIEEVDPFRKTYLSLELARNFPLAHAQTRFDPGPLHPIVTYRYVLDPEWVMGIGGQFKILRRQEPTEHRETALWTVFHEAVHVVRLDHPTYLGIGPKLLYMLPGRAARLPLQRDETLVTEIGAALTVSVHRVVDDWLLSLRVDRWRGVTSNRLHGLEVALGVSRAL